MFNFSKNILFTSQKYSRGLCFFNSMINTRIRATFWGMSYIRTVHLERKNSDINPYSNCNITFFLRVQKSKIFWDIIKQITFELNIIQFYPIKFFFFWKYINFQNLYIFDFFRLPGEWYYFKRSAKRHYFLISSVLK